MKTLNTEQIEIIKERIEYELKDLTDGDYSEKRRLIFDDYDVTYYFSGIVWKDPGNVYQPPYYFGKVDYKILSVNDKEYNISETIEI